MYKSPAQKAGLLRLRKTSQTNDSLAQDRRAVNLVQKAAAAAAGVALD
jgi:hypothetical protein